MHTEDWLDSDSFFDVHVASNILGEAVPTREVWRDDADVRLLAEPGATVGIGSSLHPAVSMQLALEADGQDVVKVLSERVDKKDAEILFRAFILDQSLRTIAKCLGISPEAVSRRLKNLRAQFPGLDALWRRNHVGWARIKPIAA